MTATATASAPATDIEKQFTISRTFNAPRDLVWKAWTEAEHLAQWWGPKGCTIRVIKLDFRPGGIFHYAMAFQPGHEMYGRFVYGDIVAPQQLQWINSFSDPEGGVTRAPFGGIAADFPLEVHNTMTLTEEGGKTTLTLRGGPLNATQAERKCFEGMFDSMQQGFAGTFDRLDEYLAKA
ncbi:MAG: polyketide cyclase [Xanthobacteraceae bacterium]|nr:polyketide cyclase [Xanthobacteraceae bacterium]